MRRPSPAFILAAIALFVALGGPAEAKRALAKLKKGSVTSKHIKNGTVAEKDVSPALITKLLAVPPVTGASVTDGSLTGADLAPGTIPAQTPPSAGSVGTDAVADGVLSGRDVGRFAGRLEDLNFGIIDKGACKSVGSTSLTPVVAGQDLRDDVILVTSRPFVPGDALAITADAASADTIRVTICNIAGADALNLGARDFSYLAIDVS